MPVFNPLAIPTQESWQTPTLLNSWQNWGTLFNDAGYWKDSYGVVHLRGVVRNGTMAANLFVLPVGYRPANRELFVAYSATQSSFTPTLGRVDVLANGEVYMSSGGNGFFSLDGLTFRAA